MGKSTINVNFGSPWTPTCRGSKQKWPDLFGSDGDTLETS